MGKVVAFRRPDRDECRCLRCRRAQVRFPADPKQLLLPILWPDELLLPNVAEA